MSVRRRGGLWLGLVVVLAGAADPPSPMEAWWADLEKGDAPAARALLRFADRKAESVAFLAGKLKPLRLDPDRVQLLLAQLGSKDKAVWKPAFEELEYFDPRLAVDLEQLMKDVTKAPARQRLVEIMSGRPPGNLEGQDVNIRATGGDGMSFNFFSRGSWWAEKMVARLNSLPGRNEKKKWTRAVRAIVFLEHVGTPEAADVLKAIATGDPDAKPTRAAQAALDRLAKGPGRDDPAVAPDLTKTGDPGLWRFIDASAEAVEEDGRKAARVATRPPKRPDETSALGIAYFLGLAFDEGTIEVDLKGRGDDEDGFLGVAYHGISGEGFEAVCFRPASFRRDGEEASRAVQYMTWPANTPETLRKEHPGKYERPIKPAPDPGGWFHARVEVKAKTVSVFVDGAKEPCLVADRLSQRASGLVGLWANPGPATFANLKITPSP